MARANKSVTETEILEVTGTKGKKTSEDVQDYYERLVEAIYELEEKEWGELGNATQKWYNQAAKAINDGEDVEAFDDGEEESEESEEAPTRGRRGASKKKASTRGSKPSGRGRAAKPEPEPEPEEDKEDSVEDLEVGQQVLLLLEDDEVEGTVSKVLRSKVIVEDEDGEKISINTKDIDELEIISGKKEEKVKENSGEEVDYDDLEEGMNIRITTSDDEVSGTVLKVLRGSVMVKPSGRGKQVRIKKVDIDLIEEIGDEEDDEEDEAPKRTSRASRTSPSKGGRGVKTGRGEKKTGRGEKKTGRAPSARSIIYGLLSDDPKMEVDALMEEVEDQLGDTIKPSTVKITHGAFIEAYNCLKAAGKIK